jgi:hypothetical protein
MAGFGRARQGVELGSVRQIKAGLGKGHGWARLGGARQGTVRQGKDQGKNIIRKGESKKWNNTKSRLMG